MNQTCDFCSNKVDKEQLLLKGEYVKILYPKKPVIEAHFMIIPIRHVVRFDQLSNDELIEIKKLIQLLKTRLNRNFHIEAYNLLSNNGKVAGQKIKHFHMHYFGRSKNELISPFEVLNNHKHILTNLLKTNLHSRILKYKKLLKSKN